MDLKKPLLFSEQVSNLIGQNMKIDNLEETENILSQINYYRLSGYALEFRTLSGESQYRDGTFFKTVYEIYNFDEKLRTLLKWYLEKIEVYTKTQIAYGFSIRKNKKAPYLEHYNKDNYYNKQHFLEILESLQREEKHNQDYLFVKHHKIKYQDKMPLWVMVELLSFSNTVKLYNAMWISEKKAIAENMNTGPDTLKNNLCCLAELRNRCAHGARLYGSDITFYRPAKLSRKFLIKHPNVEGNNLFAYIIVLIRRLPNIEDKKNFVNRLELLIEKYKDHIHIEHIFFPEDYFKILQELIK